MIQLTDQPIHLDELLAGIGSPEAGAIVFFAGTARRTTSGRRTESLEYECYPEMVHRMLADLRREAIDRWSLQQCIIVHRLGRIEIGQVAVAIAVTAPHRHEAYEASRWLIDRIKQVVPIWKKENWADGTEQWIHPEANHASGGPDV